MTDDIRLRAAAELEAAADAAKGERWHVLQRGSIVEVETDDHLFVAEVDDLQLDDAALIAMFGPKVARLLAEQLRDNADRHVGDVYETSDGQIEHYCSTCRDSSEEPWPWPCPDAAGAIATARAVLREEA